jgi:phosphoglycolate phosphatase-like HAD superfamily hydrolase
MYKRCGVGLDQDLLAAVDSMEPTSRDAAWAVIDEMEAEGRRTLELCSGTIDLAKWLAERGIPMAVVTRNSATTVDHLNSALWTATGLPPLSLAISRDTPGIAAKPDPAALHIIAATWDAPLSSLLMVGDSPKNDIIFGKAAEVATALVDSGRQYVEGGSGGNCGADFTVESLGDLPALLDACYCTAPVFTNGNAPPLSKYPKPAPAGEAAIAAAAGDLSRLKMLPVEALSKVDETSGNTPIVWAADAGHLDVVNLLISAGVPCEVPGYLGATALARACRSGHTAIVSALLATPSGYSSIDLPNNKQQYPLHFAAFKKHPETVQVMLQRGASTTVTDRKGRTPAEDTSVESIREAILSERADRLECARSRFSADVRATAQQHSIAGSASSSKEDRIKGAYFGALVADALTLGSHYEYDAPKIKEAYGGTISKFMGPGEMMGGETHGIGWGKRNYHPGEFRFNTYWFFIAPLFDMSH